jgi:hypothetical protein
MNKNFCDKCGKEIMDLDHLSNVRGSGVMHAQGYFSFDLCPSCFVKVAKVIKEFKP